jgi:hypothetical protein
MKTLHRKGTEAAERGSSFLCVLCSFAVQFLFPLGLSAANLHWDVPGRTIFASFGTAICQTGIKGIGMTNTTSGATSYTVATSNTPPANALLLVSVAHGASTAPNIPTISVGHGTTWVMIATTNWGLYRLSLFRSMTNAAPTATAIIADFGGQTQWGCNLRACYFTNVVTMGTWGSGAVVQSVMTTNSTTNPSATLAALNGSTNAVYCAFINNINGYGADSIDAGWTQDIQNGFNTTATGQCNIYAIETSDNTPSITDGAQAWGAIAVEIQKACP